MLAHSTFCDAPPTRREPRSAMLAHAAICDAPPTRREPRSAVLARSTVCDAPPTRREPRSTMSNARAFLARVQMDEDLAGKLVEVGADMPAVLELAAGAGLVCSARELAAACEELLGCGPEVLFSPRWRAEAPGGGAELRPYGSAAPASAGPRPVSARSSA